MNLKKYCAIIVIAFLSISCSTEFSKENILGTWKVTNFNSETDLAPPIIGALRKIALTVTYEFNAEGTYIYKDKTIDSPEIRPWEIKQEPQTILLMNQIYLVQSFSKNKMVLIEILDLGMSEYTLERFD